MLMYGLEIFPLRLRALEYAIGVALIQAVSEVFSMKLLSLYKAIAIDVPFFLFKAIGVGVLLHDNGGNRGKR